MWNEFKLRLTASLVFLREFILINLFTAAVIFFSVKNGVTALLLILLLILLSVFLLILIGKKRRMEFAEIEKIINGIRKNHFGSAEDIILTRPLYPLQEAIKKMFDKNRKDIEYLNRLERVRREFLGNVSHELRTPIFTIQGYLETLLDGALEDKAVNRKFIEKANTHTHNLNDLLNDLIDISMIESGEMRMSFRYFDVNSFLKGVCAEYKEMAENKGISLLFIPSVKGCKVYGDKNKISQVMTNLLVNAVKYTEKGEITVSVSEEKYNCRITVKDTGIGIPQDDIDRIFERFYRVDKARSRDVGGTGLGLAIVKHIIEAHQSRVVVKSREGEGSEFSFTLKK